MFCEKCGKEIMEGAAFCDDCGTAVKKQINWFAGENKVVIISGFQGENSLNQTITLGRGGSDTTAVALGCALNANVKIYTDVKGFYSLNPTSYKSPKLLKTINITSAIELANVNAKVLDFRCLSLANQNKTPINVGDYKHKTKTSISFSKLENYKIDGISSKNKILFVKNQSKNNIF